MLVEGVVTEDVPDEVAELALYKLTLPKAPHSSEPSPEQAEVHSPEPTDSVAPFGDTPQ
jgi:hypothetical protein